MTAVLTPARISLPLCLPRWSTPRTPSRQTYGAHVARIAEALGTPLMPWQRLVADVALEVDETTGRLAYREVRLTVPRQSGKTTLMLPVMVQRALAFEGRQRIVYTAQSRNEARQKWEDEHVPVLERSVLARQFRVRKTNGNEALLWRNGSIHSLIATTAKSGHGKTLDLGMIDEAFAQPDDRLEQSMKPAMITRPQPQLWVVSTAGRPESSPYLWGKVEDGRALAQSGVTKGVAYFEWSAPEDAAASDPATWWGCMPALGHTVTEDAVAADYESMKEPEFRRAYLNQWFAPASESVIPAEAWLACADATADVQDAPIAFAVDTSPDRSSTSIAMCGVRADGLEQVEIVDHRAGTGWVAERLAELVDRWSPVGVAVDPAGPAGSLIGELPGLPWKTTGARDVVQACGGLYDAVLEGKLRHRGDLRLNIAVEGASKRNLGEAWAWSRKNSAVDISPLVAVTLARWLFTTRPAPDEATAEPFVLFG
jgi:hypothetical protein